MEYENKELCSSCKGMCCKKSGCDYFVSDFERITKDEILKALLPGKISIVSAFKKSVINGKVILTPFLYLRARNKDRDIVDLFSMKKTCSMLTDTGCSYSLEDRPGGGVNLIPKKNGCKPLKDPIEEMRKWEPYQGVLAKIVKRITGKSVDKILREDVEEVLYQILTEQFDGISKREIADIVSGLQDLILAFPNEYENAKIRAKKYIKIYEKKTTE